MPQPHQVYRSWLAGEGKAFAAALDGDPAAPVPSCPGWSMTDLAAHVGSFHRWAADLIQEAAPAPRMPYSLTPDPATPLSDWYLACLDQLLEAIDTTDPETPMWTVTVGQKAGDWCRRQTHDLAIHRWDAQNARSHAQPIAAERATDLMDELFDAALPYLLPFQGKSAPDRALELRSTDGAYIRHVGGPPPDAIVTGTPSDLLLTLWSRTGRATLTGDPAALSAWQKAIGG